MVWSGLVDQQKVDHLIGQNVISEVVEPQPSKNIAHVGPFKHSVFVFVFVVFDVFVFVFMWKMGVRYLSLYTLTHSF